MVTDQGDAANEYVGEAHASSRHSQDWGRAVVVALTDLVAAIRHQDGNELGDELLDTDLTMRFVADDDEGGVRVRISWTPPAQD